MLNFKNIKNVRAYILGLALILLAFHIFLPIVPAVGYLILFGLIAIFGVEHLVLRKKIDFGPKAILIPLLILFLITVIQVIIGTTTASAMIFMLSMVLIYLMSREYNEQAFHIFIPALVVVSFSCIIMNGIINPGIRSGGLLHPTNYNIAVGFLALGMVMARTKWQWLVVILVIPGILMTGGEEGLVFLAGFALLVIVRKDFSKKLIPLGALLGVALLVFTLLGTTQTLYFQVKEKIQAVTIEQPQDLDTALLYIFKSRWTKNKEAVQNTSILGHGFNPTDASIYSIHNIPLKILNEMGPIGMASWLWLVGYGFFKLNRKYIFGTIFLLSIFDNFVWTQLTPYMFVALGISLPTNDYIFRGPK